MRFLLPFFLIAGLARSVFAHEISLEVLEEINLARTCPHQYAQLLAERMDGARSATSRRSVAETVSFLQKQKPLPPLDFSDGLMLGAQRHVNDQGPRGTIGHTGSDHSHPSDRIAKFGHWVGSAGENISYGYSDAKKVVATLIVDQGVSGKGHRKNIFSADFGVAGVAAGHHARYGSMCVIDFAGTFAPPESKIAFATASVRRWSSPNAVLTR